MNSLNLLVTSLISLWITSLTLIVPVTEKNSSTNTHTSLNWSGYSSTNGPFSGVTATWVVNALDGSGDFGIDATWVGIGGVTGSDLIQAGTQREVSGDGRVIYNAFYETLPEAARSLDIDINANDSVTVSLNKQDQDLWQITFTNNTTKQTLIMIKSYSSSSSSVEWIEEAASNSHQLLPLADFGYTHFTDAYAVKDGKILPLQTINAYPIIMANTSGDPLAIPSDIDTDINGFTVTQTSPLKY